MFVVVSSQTSFNMLLGREWIHGMVVVPSTMHYKIFFWNEDSKLEFVEINQTSYGVYASFVDESD